MARVRDCIGTGSAPINAQAVAGTAGSLTAVGTSQGAGTLLSYETNFITTASSQVAVVLPTGAQGSMPGDTCYVFCNTSDTATVYPGGSDTINGSSSAVNVAQNKMAIIKRFNATQWGLIVTA